MALRAIWAISMRADVVISPMTSTMPVVAAVSQATRPMGVLLEHGVEHAVGDKVAQLVGMALCNGL